METISRVVAAVCVLLRESVRVAVEWSVEKEMKEEE